MASTTTQPTQQTQALTRQNPAFIVEMAGRFGMEPAKLWETVVATVMPANATGPQVMVFLQVANQYKLNPFLRQIFAFPTKGGGIVPMVPVDGWIDLIQNHKEYNGVEFEYHWDNGATSMVQPKDNGKPVQINAITCKLHRKGITLPTVITEYFGECFMPNKEPWQKWPVRMLRHKALIQCARVAFGLSGIYDEDEAERIASTGGTVIPGSGQIIDASVPQVSSTASQELRDRIDAAKSKPQNGANGSASGERADSKPAKEGSTPSTPATSTSHILDYGVCRFCGVAFDSFKTEGEQSHWMRGACPKRNQPATEDRPTNAAVAQSTAAPSAAAPTKVQDLDEDPKQWTDGQDRLHVAGTVVKEYEPKAVGKEKKSTKKGIVLGKGDAEIQIGTFHKTHIEMLAGCKGKFVHLIISSKGQYWNVDFVLQVADKEWLEDGTPVIRREVVQPESEPQSNDVPDWAQGFEGMEEVGEEAKGPTADEVFGKGKK